MSTLAENAGGQSQVVACQNHDKPARGDEVPPGAEPSGQVTGSMTVDEDDDQNIEVSDAGGERPADPQPIDAASRPESSSSRPASSSSSAQSNKTATSTTITHTMGKFKDKRPEPLKLNANLNQEIPLDLSVRSAGNVPSGSLGNIFNLQPNQMMTTLETPRIIWQDNEALLIKPRLFSSSTNASQRIKLSSLAGDSPPITPNTPFLDMIYSPTSGSNRPLSSQPHSAGLLYDSASFVQALMSAQMQYKQQQLQLIEDSFAGKMLLSGANNRRSNTNFRSASSNLKDLARSLPRRSCSTESLSGHLNGTRLFQQLTPQTRCQEQQQQTNYIANHQASNTANRFSYSGQQISANRDSASSNGNSNSNSDSNASGTTKGTGKTLTPTGLASATTNLFNINLNSPSNQASNQVDGPQVVTPAQVSPSLSELVLAASQQHHQHIQQLQRLQRPPSPMEVQPQFLTQSAVSTSDADPLLSAAYCQQHQSQQTGGGSFRSSLASAFSTSSSSSCSMGATSGAGANQEGQQQTPEANANRSEFPSLSSSTAYRPIISQHQGGLLHQHQPGTPSSGNLLGSLGCGGSATLNTPTLISPSQLKGGSICFLPSPTLSPMSSVFDMPSPLLMFPPPTSASLSQSQKQSAAATGGSNPKLSPSNLSSSESRMISEPMLASFSRHFGASQTSGPRDLQTGGQQVLAGFGSGGRVASCEAALNLHERDTQQQQQQQHKQFGAAASEADLAHLITPAHDKVGPDVADDEARKIVSMEQDDMEEPMAEANFPRILVSDEQQRRQCESADPHWLEPGGKMYPPVYTHPPACNTSSSRLATTAATVTVGQQHRSQRDITNKRALSPLSFRNQVSYYHNQRYESCSAPPDVYQGRARPKLKGLNGCESGHQPPSGSCQPNVQHHNTSYKPYPDPQVVAPRWQAPSTNLHQLGAPFANAPSNGARSSSADPPINESQFYLSERTFAGPNQVASGMLQQGNLLQHTIGGYNFSQSVQHLHGNFHSQSATTNFGSESSFAGTNSAGRQLTNPTPSNNHENNHRTLHHQSQQLGHHQMQSVSAGEIHRLQTADGCGLPAFINRPQAQCLITGRPPGSHIPRAGPDQQQSAAMGAATFLASSRTDGLDHLHNHCQSELPSTLPFQVAPAPQHQQQQQQQHCAPSFPNQLVQGQPPPAQADWLADGLQVHREKRLHQQLHLHPHQHQHPQQQQQQQQTRALSVDGRDSSLGSIPMRPESAFSGSNSDIAGCFRSSSTTLSCISGIGESGANAPAKKYRCDQCSKSFNRSDMLTRHKRLHSGDRPFQCSECKQEFSRSDHLSTHVRTHTGEKPYKCKLCSYSACRKDMIARHMKVHNRGSPNAQQPTAI